MSRQGKTKVKNGGAQCVRIGGGSCFEGSSNGIVSRLEFRSAKIGRRTNFSVQQFDEEEIGECGDNYEIQDGVQVVVGTTTRLDAAAAIKDRTGTMDEDDDVEDENGLLDAQKVDEWLKNRSDSLSSIEFDTCEIKQEDDYEFDQAGVTSCDDPVKIRTATEQLAELFMKARPSSPPADQQDVGREHLEKSSSGCSRGNGNMIKSTLQMSKSILRQVRKHCVVSPKTTMVDTSSRSTEDAATILVQGTVDREEVAGFVGLASLKDIMLMTPQELERMPESGIEFEESVGPKEFEILCKQENQVLDHRATASTLLHASNDGSRDRDIVDSVVGTSGDAGDSGGGGGNAGDTTELAGASSTLATISISTDKLTNTTSIVINTKQGQQSFKINTANMMQAAATLQPITLADLVDQPPASAAVDVGDELTGKDAAVVTTPSIRVLAPVKGKKKKAVRMKSLLIPVKPVTAVASASPAADVQSITSNVSEVVESRPSTVSCVQDDKGSAVAVCTHSGRCKKAWKCPEPDCNKVYNKQCKLKVHLKTHSNLRPYRCNVEGCDWSFASIYKLKRHLETHCAAKDFVCDHDGCNRRFTTIYNLKSHKRLHAQPKSICCPIDNCDSLFPTRRKMELHMKEHRGVEAPYKCPVDACDKAYFTTNSMASHLRSHQKTSFQCPVQGCEAVLDKMSRFKVHMWRHTGERPYPCTHEGCSWAFSSASKLNRHARKHTGERRYECKEPNCGKSFMRLEHLQGHVVTHSGDKPYACHYKDCDARFTARSSLYVHLKKHDGRADKTVYPCQVTTCNKRYTCKSSLRIHMLRYHSTKLQGNTAPQVEYITLLASDGVQDATTTVDEFGQIVNPIARSLSFTDPSVVPGEIQIKSAMESLSTAADIDEPDSAHLIGLDEQSDLPTMPISTEIPEASAQFLEITASDVQEATVVASVDDVEEITITSPTPVDAVILPSTSDVELLMTRVLQENHSGSARTDYCSNHMLVERARKRRQLERDLQIGESFSLADTGAVGTQPLVADVLAYRDALAASINFIHGPALQEDLPAHVGDLYHEEDVLTTPISGELALSMMLVDPATSANCGAHHHGPPDFCASSSSAVTEFTGTTINLRDLE